MQQHRVDPDNLRAVLAKSQEQGACSEELAHIFLQLAYNISCRPNFNGYSYVEDLVQNGAARCCQKFDRFQLNSESSPFSYFSRVLWNSFVQDINRENDHRDLVNSLLREDGYPEKGWSTSPTCKD